MFVEIVRNGLATQIIRVDYSDGEIEDDVDGTFDFIIP